MKDTPAVKTTLLRPSFQWLVLPDAGVGDVDCFKCGGFKCKGFT